MESIALTTEFIGSFTYMGSIVLLAIAACGILLGYMAEEEASGERIFRAESPFTDVSEGKASVESIPYLRAA